MLIERYGNLLEILPRGFGGLFQKAGGMLIKLVSPSPRVESEPAATDVYVPPPLSAACVDRAQLEHKLAYLQQQHVILEKNVEYANGAYLTALGGAALSTSVAAFGVVCLCSVPWALLGGPILALSTYFVPQAFTLEKQQRKLKQTSELQRDMSVGKIQWHVDKLRALSDYQAAHPAPKSPRPPKPPKLSSTRLSASENAAVSSAAPRSHAALDLAQALPTKTLSTLSQHSTAVATQSYRLARQLGQLQAWMPGADIWQDFFGISGGDRQASDDDTHVIVFGGDDGYIFSVPDPKKDHRE